MEMKLYFKQFELLDAK